MIVEDERIVALDLQEALEALGYVVAGMAASSDEALRAVARERPDLVLMDIRIVGQRDGIETAQLLRDRHRLPVVYLTANADRDTVERALETQPVGYLLKPYNQLSLWTTIEVAFRLGDAEQALHRAHEQETARLHQHAAEISQRAEQLSREASIDALTGLYNRRHLEHVLERELTFGQREGHAVSVVLLDLDYFKQLNDKFGHAVGDAALRGVADFVRSRLRGYDVACRYGGEEIVIIVPGAEIEAATALAEHLRAGIELLIVAQSARGSAELPRLTASFGVSSFPLHGLDSEAVFQAADAALYRAKAEGRNRVVRADATAVEPP